MNYLEQLVNNLNLDGIYYTPKELIDKLNTDCIIGNPPYKVWGSGKPTPYHSHLRALS